MAVEFFFRVGAQFKKNSSFVPFIIGETLPVSHSYPNPHKNSDNTLTFTRAKALTVPTKEKRNQTKMDEGSAPSARSQNIRRGICPKKYGYVFIMSLSNFPRIVYTCCSTKIEGSSRKQAGNQTKLKKRAPHRVRNPGCPFAPRHREWTPPEVPGARAGANLQKWCKRSPNPYQVTVYMSQPPKTRGKRWKTVMEFKPLQCDNSPGRKRGPTPWFGRRTHCQKTRYFKIHVSEQTKRNWHTLLAKKA